MFMFRSGTDMISSWSAVARGAAAIGLEQAGESVVTSRLCRRFYGTSCSKPFKKGVHLKGDAYINEYHGTKYAANQASWLISKGQELSVAEETHAYTPISHTFWPHEKPTLTMALFACDADIAPHRIVTWVRCSLEKPPKANSFVL